MNRAATFAFYIGDHGLAVVTRPGSRFEAAALHFLSLPVQILKTMEPALRPRSPTARHHGR